MSQHKTQLERVRSKLLRAGFVTRNECLRQFPAITRLSARIQDLEEKFGYVFTHEEKHGDYIYRLVTTPESINRAALAAFDAA